MFETKAPAKLNLSLRILGKREDGYHEIDTTMVRLEGLEDTLEFHEADGYSLECDVDGIPVDEGNLVTQAVRAYEAAAGVACRYRIRLIKRIPHAAGLGGGSSDAAAVLKALDKRNPKPLGIPKLMEIAAHLGSDVPFFLGTACARCTGRGERIESQVPPAVPLRILLLKPSFPVATPDAYQQWSSAKPLAGVSYDEQKLDGLALVNDLERPVFSKHLFLAELKMWLMSREETAGALLAGSGSTVFAVLHYGVDGEALAEAARAELDPHLWHACVSVEAGA